MPKKRAKYVRAVTVPLPMGHKGLVREAAGLAEMSVTQFATRAIRAALASGKEPSRKAGERTESFSLELPGDLVDSIEAKHGKYNVGALCRTGILAALKAARAGV